MNIEADKFKIEMSHSELWDTAFDIRAALHDTLKTHWINHQRDWMSHESKRLQRMRMCFNALGRIDVYEEIFPFSEKVFSEFNSKRIKE